jgi:phosphoribosylglycinamide formyltransferase-1
MKLAVLISGRGSNFVAIAEAVRDGRIGAEIVAVISNRPEAPGLERARELGLPAFAIDHKACESREAHEGAVIAVLRERGAELIALAGYMRLLSPSFVAAFRNRIVNIHPSLLPSFPGVDAQSQAVAHGVKVSGCTVHIVDENLDAGPIVLQRPVEVRTDDTAETLAARILAEEHEAYVEALTKMCRGYRVEARRVVFTSDG